MNRIDRLSLCLPTSVRHSLTSGVWCCGLLCASVTAAQDAPGNPNQETVAGVGGVDDAVEVIGPATAGAVPPELPGQKLGPRTVEPAAEATPAGEREWFGGLPPWEWSRLTGDWAGARTWLEEHGLTIEGSFTIEWADAISGGLSRKWVSRNIFDLNATFDTDKLFGWKGGTFYVDVASSDSTEGGTFVPGTQWTSTIEIGGDTFQLANVWYQQELFDGAFRAKFGKIDPTTEFGYSNATAGYMNLGSLYPMTFLTVPTYPYSSLGGVAYVYPCENFYVGAGVFDANFTWDQFVPDDQFDDVWAAGEAGLTFKTMGPFCDVRFAFGGRYDSSDFTHFDTGAIESAYGLYGLAEGRICSGDCTCSADDASDDCGLWLFGQWSYADPSVIEPQLHYGGGLALHGVCAGREADKLGLYVGRMHYSGSPSVGIQGQETAIELFYAFQVTPSVTFTPDIQFLLDPGGDESVTDPIVFSMRLELDF
jgi:porin